MATYYITVLSSSNVNGWQLSVNGSGAATNPDIGINIDDIIVWTFQQSSSHPFRITGQGTIFGDYTTGTETWNPGTNPGTYEYRCTNHGTMVGEITVINPSDPTTTAAPTTTASPTTTAAPTTTTTTTPPPTTTPAPTTRPPYSPEYFPAGPDEREDNRNFNEHPLSPDFVDSSVYSSHESDTEDLPALDTVTGEANQLARVTGLSATDSKQNPIIKSADISKGGGSGSHYSQGTYPFTGRILAQDTAVSWSKNEVGGNGAESFNDDIADGGSSRSYLRFWFTKNAQGFLEQQKHRSTIVTPFYDMLIWNVNTLDDFGNASRSDQYRGVSFFRPQYIKNPNVAFDVLDGTNQWTRTTKVNKGGDGALVSPMSNSEKQIDLELIGGFTYIHNAGNTLGTGAMQIGGQPVKINIIATPPQRSVYSRYG